MNDAGGRNRALQLTPPYWGPGPPSYQVTTPVGYIRAHASVPYGVGVRSMSFVGVPWGEMMAVLWEDDLITFTPLYCAAVKR